MLLYIEISRECFAPSPGWITARWFKLSNSEIKTTTKMLQDDASLMSRRVLAYEKSLTQDCYMRVDFHEKIDFYEILISDWFGTIHQHENSSRNWILTTTSSRNWPTLRNHEKHDLSDKTASPASWGTFKFKISLLTQQILWIATPGEILEWLVEHISLR